MCDLSGLTDLDAKLLPDFACLDPVYVDGLCAGLNLGANVNLLFFRHTAAPNNGRIIYERTPALSLIIPRMAFLSQSKSCAWTINQQSPPHIPMGDPQRFN